MIRIWGGGIYPLDEFSDACDEYGVMIYMDMMYAQGGHGAMTPITVADQERELRHQIRRQSHHPSIVGWTGWSDSDAFSICRAVRLANPKGITIAEPLPSQRHGGDGDDRCQCQRLPGASSS